MPQVASRTTEQQHPSTTCPDCDGEITQSGWERYCKECGLVVDVDRVDHGPEWRSFDSEERKRVGAPRTQARHDRGLSTKISKGADARGNAISSDKQRRLRRQRRLHSQSQTRSKRERNQMQGFIEIKRIASALELGHGLVEQACSLFETAQSEDLLIGRSIEAGAAAAVFITCRMNNSSRQAQAVAQFARCSVNTIWNMYSTIARELALPVPIQQPLDFIPEIIGNLDDDVPAQLRTDAERLTSRFQQTHQTQGKKPSAVAAAALYAVSRRDEYDRITQQALAEAADVSSVSIRSHWEAIREFEAE